MPHPVNPPSFSGFKLSDDREVRHGRHARNQWLAADRFERWWQVAVVAGLVVLLATSAALITWGLTRP